MHPFSITKDELQKIEHAEIEVIKATEIIQETEHKIHEEEKQILVLEHQILKQIKTHPIRTLARGGFTRKELQILHKVFVRKLSKHRLIFTLIITFGVVLIWRGFWEVTAIMPLLSSPFVCLLVGFVVLWGVKKYTEL